MEVMSISYQSEIVIVGTHGRNLGQYLKDHLTTKGVRSSVVGVVNIKSRNVRHKVRHASTLICINADIQKEVEGEFDLEEKHLICLDVQEMPSSKPLSGEAWLAYQEEVARPEIERQIKKHAKALK